MRVLKLLFSPRRRFHPRIRSRGAIEGYDRAWSIRVGSSHSKLLAVIPFSRIEGWRCRGMYGDEGWRFWDYQRRKLIPSGWNPTWTPASLVRVFDWRLWKGNLLSWPTKGEEGRQGAIRIGGWLVGDGFIWFYRSGEIRCTIRSLSTYQFGWTCVILPYA